MSERSPVTVRILDEAPLSSLARGDLLETLTVFGGRIELSAPVVYRLCDDPDYPDQARLRRLLAQNREHVSLIAETEPAAATTVEIVSDGAWTALRRGDEHYQVSLSGWLETLSRCGLVPSMQEAYRRIYARAPDTQPAQARAGAGPAA